MKRILLSGALLAAIAAFVILAGGAASSNSSTGSYKIELDDAFGLTSGAQFKIAGVPAGAIESIDLCSQDPAARCSNPLHALVTVSVNQKGFTQFRSDAFCSSRPQSLIGEYFIECQPGHSGPILDPKRAVPVSHTQSTIPADLLGNVMRLPYRQRFTLIINELGAAVAGRSGDLQAALKRAVPALTQTDNLLNLLGNDSHTLQQLTADSDSVITALANNSSNVQRFIVEANNAATDTATQSQNLQATLHDFPGFLEQLKPAMAKLSTAAVTNEPVLANLNAASGQLTRLFTDLPAFSRSAQPALKSLGQASLTGTPAMQAAAPTVRHLNQFTGGVGCQQASPHVEQCLTELAQNLSIVLKDLDTQNRAVEADRRSPGGKGFSGLQALLQYVFNQPLAINAYSQFGHLLTVDAFIDPRCAPYATPQKIANNLSQYGASYRQCYAWLGPNQPGINEPDPSNPGACVPDPGGAPPGRQGPQTSACKLAPNPSSSLPTPSSPLPVAADVGNRSASSGSGGGGGGGSGAGSSGGSLAGRIGNIFSSLGGGSAASSAATRPASSAVTSPASSAATSTASGAAAGGSGSAPAGDGSTQAKQLLNYLLAP